MSKQILVPLRRNDGIDEIVPYVERLTQPGMKVVFLLRYPVDGFIWSRPREESSREAILAAEKLAKHYSWEENLQRAQRKVSHAFEVLQRKGVEVAVDVYAGSLRKAVKSYTLKSDVHLLMTRAGIGHWIANFFNGTNSVFKLFKRPSFSPVLLIHPRTLL